jgi:glycosyltransferase involved in cell wall biosynthesis
VRVALVHYWLVGMRGGEKVLEALCRIFPEADIFTLFWDPAAVSPLIRSRNVQTSWLNPLRRIYRQTLPLMPMALEDLDLRGYDLIVSSEAGPAKGIIAPSTSRHLCYCHTPMRYLWDLYPAYRHEFPRNAFSRAAMSVFGNYLRVWDHAAADRVDGFVANSQNVRRRIWKTYRRRARVVHPGVEVEKFTHAEAGDYCLIVAELVRDKRIDYAVRAFARHGRRLKIVGEGPEYAALRRQSSPNIEFCGRVSDTELRALYSRCRALLSPGEEDFGLTMVEALASGKPVVALARGGSCEIVGRKFGVLYPEPSETHLDEGLRTLDRNVWDSAELQAAALRYSGERFDEGIVRSLAALRRVDLRRFPGSFDWDAATRLLRPDLRDRFTQISQRALT